nr:hypothetical protein [Lachnospiraceae bacterium]
MNDKDILKLYNKFIKDGLDIFSIENDSEASEKENPNNNKRFNPLRINNNMNNLLYMVNTFKKIAKNHSADNSINKELTEFTEEDKKELEKFYTYTSSNYPMYYEFLLGRYSDYINNKRTENWLERERKGTPIKTSDIRYQKTITFWCTLKQPGEPKNISEYKYEQPVDEADNEELEAPVPLAVSAPENGSAPENENAPAPLGNIAPVASGEENINNDNIINEKKPSKALITSVLGAVDRINATGIDVKRFITSPIFRKHEEKNIGGNGKSSIDVLVSFLDNPNVRTKIKQNFTNNSLLHVSNELSYI